MDELTSSEIFWNSLQLGVVVLSVLLIKKQLKLQGASHNIQSMLALHEKWQSKEMMIARREVCIGYKESTNKLNNPDDYLACYFEYLGNYVNKGALPMSFVWNAFSFEIEHYWPMLEERIIKFREYTDDETLYGNFEKLHSKCVFYGRFKNFKNYLRKLPVNIEGFIELETQRIDYYSDLQKQNAPRIISHSRSSG